MTDKSRDRFIFKQLKENLAFEWDRASKLDDKAVNIASSTGAILTLFIGLAPFTFQIIDIKNAPLTVIILFLLCLIFLVSAISVSLLSIQPKSFKSVDIKKFIEVYSDDDIDFIIKDYGGNIKHFIIDNSVTINKKASSVEHALNLLMAGIITMFFYILHILILIYPPPTG
jgi:hypothetical protein